MVRTLLQTQDKEYTVKLPECCLSCMSVGHTLPVLRVLTALRLLLRRYDSSCILFVDKHAVLLQFVSLTAAAEQRLHVATGAAQTSSTAEESCCLLGICTCATEAAAHLYNAYTPVRMDQLPACFEVHFPLSWIK